ncbi:nuclear pore complex protein Nup98-Nup96-like isoform X1 [Cylas formicarius]|uniref:nuclear pore complex protein Nup98-Nup96-like isoform X1 n=1 Tax=Cylas formicarius TaxID=197179 RepID=UPI0029583363|nr:nuclear pore complex protein Nup98-Nup96-like isoform X1 [Cylas formicarius]
MFGNLGNKPAFGAAAPSTSFGFGQNANTTNPFGQNQNLFSKPAAAFGSTTTSTFGQPAGSSMFPSTQPQQSNLFQTNTSTFGAAPTTQSGFGSNLFGQQPAAGGLFNTTSTFGQQNKPTTFGFVGNQTQPTLFGSPQQQPTSSIFTPSGGTGLFSSSTGFGGQQTGTVIKFNPVTGTDTMMKNGNAQNINTKHHSITCMKEYENKSFEELRFEDYQANRKGPQQMPGFGSSTFGAPVSSAPTLFGQTDANKPAFGQSTAFGQTTAPFGQTPSSGFGLGQNTTTSPFGAKPTGFGAPTSSAFGFATTAAPNANPFGANQAAKPFGAAPTQPLFSTNTTPQTSSAFGTGLFTNTQNAGTGLFNKPAQPVPAFGTTGQNPGFSFNTPASTQSSLFNTASKPLFGTTNTTPAFGSNTFGTNTTGFNSTFGKPAPAFGAQTQSAFGSTLGSMTNSNTGGIFGNANQQKPGGGLFSSGTTGLFGNTAAPFQSGTGFGLGQPQQQTSMLNVQDQQPINNLALLTNDPFGDAPHLAGLEPKYNTGKTAVVSTTNPKELKSLLDASKKIDVSHNSKLRVTPLKSIRDSLFDSIPKSEEMIGNSPTGGYQKSSCRRLVLKSRSSNDNSSGLLSSNILDVLNTENKENLSETKTSSEGKPAPLRLDFNSSTTANETVLNNSIETQTYINNDSSVRDVVGNDLLTSDVNDEPDEPRTTVPDERKVHPTGVICTRPEYYTLPNLDELSLDQNGCCFVRGFTIGRRGYGNVYFPDEMDVAGLNIDELVHFRYREINVYPDDTKKPPVGSGLNRRAQVTLDNVYPRKAGSNVIVKDVDDLVQMNFAEKLRRVTEKKGVRFVDYRPETGSWVFKVDHFSKYGYNDSDEDNDQYEIGDVVQKSKREIANGNEKVSERATKESAKILLGKKGSPLIGAEGDRLTKSTGFGLEKDIFVNDDDDQSDKNDLLHQSMLVDDFFDEDYHRIPPEVPMDLHFGSYENSRNIQVMKSTLFAEDDRLSDGTGSHISILKQYLDLPEMDDIPTMPVLQEEISMRKRPLLRPKVWTVLNGYDTPGSIDVVLPSRCCTDMAMLKGKSFKVGWSKGFNFTVYGDADRESNGEVMLKTFNRSPDFDPLKDVLIDALRVVLEESTFELGKSRIPTFKVGKTSSYLQKQTALFETLALQYNSKQSVYLYSIWTLCTALWGPAENTVSNRRHLLTEWLKVTTISDELPLKTGRFGSVGEAVESIFAHLSTFQIFEAASIAMNGRLPSLSLLIAQLSVPNATKTLLQEQIDIWYSSLAANHISDAMKKLYLLLSGVPTKDGVNIFDGIDWKRAFAMHLWYMCPAGAPVEMAIELYKKSFEEFYYAKHPSPVYSTESGSDEGPFDVIYHILMLYKSGIHRLSSVLNPATVTDDPLDYRLSWLLLQLFLSLKVGLIEVSEANKLCTSFSNQLEELGHWEWAVFVLLYLEDSSAKETLIMGILDRNLSPESDGERQEIVDTLINDMHIPAEWVHKVKGYKCLHLERYLQAFNHFALAKDYIAANNILIDHLLPNLFINEQFDVLKNLVDKISSGSKGIRQWHNQAGLFYEFLELQEQTLTSVPESSIELRMKLSSISGRIGNFPLNSDQQKLCVAELSKRCALLYKELCKTMQWEVFFLSYNQFIESLIMPPDFKQTEGLYFK